MPNRLAIGKRLGYKEKAPLAVRPPGRRSGVRDTVTRDGSNLPRAVSYRNPQHQDEGDDQPERSSGSVRATETQGAQNTQRARPENVRGSALLEDTSAPRPLICRWKVSDLVYSSLCMLRQALMSEERCPLLGGNLPRVHGAHD